MASDSGAPASAPWTGRKATAILLGVNLVALIVASTALALSLVALQPPPPPETVTVSERTTEPAGILAACSTYWNFGVSVPAARNGTVVVHALVRLKVNHTYGTFTTANVYVTPQQGECLSSEPHWGWAILPLEETGVYELTASFETLFIVTGPAKPLYLVTAGVGVIGDPVNEFLSGVLVATFNPL